MFPSPGSTAPAGGGGGEEGMRLSVARTRPRPEDMVCWPGCCTLSCHTPGPAAILSLASHDSSRRRMSLLSPDECLEGKLCVLIVAMVGARVWPPWQNTVLVIVTSESSQTPCLWHRVILDICVLRFLATVVEARRAWAIRKLLNQPA